MAVKTHGKAVKTDGKAVKTDGKAVKTDGKAVKVDGLLPSRSSSMQDQVGSCNRGPKQLNALPLTGWSNPLQ